MDGPRVLIVFHSRSGNTTPCGCRLGSLWARGQLQNKVGAAFTSASSPHGGHEMTLVGFLVAMMHFGMIVAAPGYIDAINHVAGAPYGATATTRVAGERRRPTEDDLSAAHALGRRVAGIGQTMVLGRRPVEPAMAVC